jgi:hypothetical protein
MQISVLASIDSNWCANIFKEEGDLWSNAHEFLTPKVKFWVTEKLDECDKSAPGVRSMNDKLFEQNLGHYFSEYVILDLNEEMMKEGNEPVRMGVRVAKIHYDRGKKMMLA